MQHAWNKLEMLQHKPEGKRPPLRRPGRKWEDNIKMYITEINCDGSSERANEWDNLLTA